MSLERIENDFYPTEESLTRELLDRHKNIWGNILEPCCGQGHITKVLNKLFEGCVTEADLTRGKDATDPNFWTQQERPDWVITNPPFSQAEKIIPLAYDHARVGIVMLLRLTYLEPTKGRAQWLQEHPISRLIVFNPRPRFRSDTKGQDSVTVAWFVWDKDWGPRDTAIEFVTGWR